MIRGNGAKYFPVDNSEMDTLIEGLDPPVSTSPAATTATFSRGSSFEQNYTTLGSLDSTPPPPAQPSTSRHSSIEFPSTSTLPQQQQQQQQQQKQRNLSEMERQYSYSPYYSNLEQEENIKCVVSSLLFIGIVLLVLVISFVYNPQMA